MNTTRVRAGGVGRPEHRARVPRVAHLVQERDAAGVLRSASSGDVDERRDPDEPLRGHGRGEPRDHVRRHGVDLDARLAARARASACELVDRRTASSAARALASASPTRLGALDQERDDPRRGTPACWSRAAAATFGFLGWR